MQRKKDPGEHFHRIYGMIVTGWISPNREYPYNKTLSYFYQLAENNNGGNNKFGTSALDSSGQTAGEKSKKEKRKKGRKKRHVFT